MIWLTIQKNQASYDNWKTLKMENKNTPTAEKELLFDKV